MRSLRSNDGSILILLSLLVGVIIGVLALVFDAMMISSSKIQLAAISESSSLSAMEAFLSANCGATPCSYPDKLSRALSRANEVARKNRIVGWSVGSAQPLGNLTLGYRCSSSSSDICSGTEALGGYLVPGRIFYGPPEAGTCGAGVQCCPNDDYPCFRANSAVETIANAFMVQTKLISPLRTMFSGFFGQGTNFAGTTQAVAGQISRYGVFLLDVSESIADETHRGTKVPCTAADENGCRTHFASTTYYDATNHQINNSTARVAYATDMLTGYPASCAGVYSVPCNTLRDMEPSRGGATWNTAPPYFYQLKRYRITDYHTPVTLREYQASGSGYTSSDRQITPDRSFMMSAGAVPTGQTKPRIEPLFSILDGTNAAISAFQQRSVSGDKAALYAFGEITYPDDSPTRVYPLDSGTDHLRKLLQVSTTDPSSTNWSSTENFITKYIFPRPGGEATNIYEALDRALQSIANDPLSDYSRSFVVLITDGVSNCTKDRNCYSYAGDVQGYQKWKDAMNEIHRDLIPQYVDAKIALHTILVGGTNVGANTLNFESQQFPGSCMDLAEAYSLLGVPTVWHGGCGRGSHEANCQSDFASAFSGGRNGIFYGINGYLALWSAMTQGGFYPIRLKDPDPHALPGQPAIHSSPGVDRRCDLELPDTQEAYDELTAGDVQVQRYDPYNRTAREQVTQAFEQIMGPAPFALFEPLPEHH